MSKGRMEKNGIYQLENQVTLIEDIRIEWEIDAESNIIDWVAVFILIERWSNWKLSVRSLSSLTRAHASSRTSRSKKRCGTGIYRILELALGYTIAFDCREQQAPWESLNLGKAISPNNLMRWPRYRLTDGNSMKQTATKEKIIGTWNSYKRWR